MSGPAPAPWLPAALGLLDAQRQERVLAIGIGTAPALQLASAVGAHGKVLVVPAGGEATALAERAPQQLQVLGRQLTDAARFGVFDALLVAPATGPLLPLGAYADLLRGNLRPGGRFVVDLPGPCLLPELAHAGRELGWPDGRLAPFCGVGDDQLADALRGAGLRSVQTLLGAHLLPAASAGDLLDAFAAALPLDDDERLQLTHALVRRSGGIGPLDVLLHRTRVTGRR